MQTILGQLEVPHANRIWGLVSTRWDLWSGVLTAALVLNLHHGLDIVDAVRRTPSSQHWVVTWSRDQSQEAQGLTRTRR